VEAAGESGVVAGGLGGYEIPVCRAEDRHLRRLLVAIWLQCEAALSRRLFSAFRAQAKPAYRSASIGDVIGA